MINVLEKIIFFEPYGFVDKLKYMGIGMLGVFMIVGIIILATYAITKLGSGKKKD